MTRETYWAPEYSWEVEVPPRNAPGYYAARMHRFELAEREAEFTARTWYLRWLPGFVRFSRWLFLAGHAPSDSVRPS